MRMRDDSLMIEGAKLYNSVPMNIRSYDGTYLGFKNHKGLVYVLEYLDRISYTFYVYNKIVGESTS